MRTTGKPDGQVNPNPAPAVACAEVKREVNGRRARSSAESLKSPGSSERGRPPTGCGS
ncbi:hypothetical protein IGB19_17170 [Streptomyces sp. AC04842]|nr:hypothetical protein [Streptomyces sp. AC04842]